MVYYMCIELCTNPNFLTCFIEFSKNTFSFKSFFLARARLFSSVAGLAGVYLLVYVLISIPYIITYWYTTYWTFVKFWSVQNPQDRVKCILPSIFEGFVWFCQFYTYETMGEISSGGPSFQDAVPIRWKNRRIQLLHLLYLLSFLYFLLSEKSRFSTKNTRAILRTKKWEKYREK